MFINSILKSRFSSIYKYADFYICIVLLIPFLLVSYILLSSFMRGGFSCSILLLLTLIVWFLKIHTRLRTYIKKFIPQKIVCRYTSIQDKFSKFKHKKSLFITKRVLYIIFVSLWTIFMYYLFLVDGICLLISSDKDNIKESYYFDVEMSDEISLTGFSKYGINNTLRLSNASCILYDCCEIFSRFPDGFFTECKDSYAGTKGMLIKFDTSNQDFSAITSYNPIKVDPITITFYLDNYTTDSSMKNISHELYHFIEVVVESNNYIFTRSKGIDIWYLYNPCDFTYYDSKYDKGTSYSLEDGKYTYEYEENPNNVYFTEEYAKTSAREDCACIFSYLLTSKQGQLPECFECAHIKTKSKILSKYIRDNFESIDDDSTMYWDHTNELTNN